MSRFEGKTCPVCKGKFDSTSDIVVCPICGTPHHRGCFSKEGECALTDLHENNWCWNGYLPEELPQEQSSESSKEVIASAARMTENLKVIADNTLEDIDDIMQLFIVQMSSPNFDTDIGEDGVSMKELMSYVGESTSHYYRAFTQFRTRKGSKLFLNFAAGFLAPGHQFYRRMNILGVAYMVLLLAPAILQCISPGLYEIPMMPTLLWVLRLVAIILLELFGDYIYYQQTVRSIVKFRNAYKGDTLSSEYFTALAEKGNPSYDRAILGCSVWCILDILMSMYAGKML